jgi:hypothetical protein
MDRKHLQNQIDDGRFSEVWSFFRRKTPSTEDAALTMDPSEMFYMHSMCRPTVTKPMAMLVASTIVRFRIVSHPC